MSRAAILSVVVVSLLSGSVLAVSGDFDADRDVDLADAGAFARCFVRTHRTLWPFGHGRAT